MNAEPVSARGMLKEWLDGGHFLQLVVAGEAEDVASPFSTVVQLTSVDETKLEAVISGTIVSMRFPGLELIEIGLGKPTEKYPAFSDARFGSNVHEPWVILFYRKYFAAFAEIR